MKENISQKLPLTNFFVNILVWWIERKNKLRFWHVELEICSRSEIIYYNRQEKYGNKVSQSSLKE